MTRTRISAALALSAALLVGGAAVAAPSAMAATKTYTMAQVKQHRTSTNCWTVINRNVYNLTAWVQRHPGGASAITSLCGKNGTTAFTGRHGYDSTAKAMLASYKIGRLA